MKRVINASYEKYTLRELKDMARDGSAIDITNESDPDIGRPEVIGTSIGTYGVNGALLQDRETGQLYVITARNSNLFRYV